MSLHEKQTYALLSEQSSLRNNEEHNFFKELEHDLRYSIRWRHHLAVEYLQTAS